MGTCAWSVLEQGGDIIFEVMGDDEREFVERVTDMC